MKSRWRSCQEATVEVLITSYLTSEPSYSCCCLVIFASLNWKQFPFFRVSDTFESEPKDFHISVPPHGKTCSEQRTHYIRKFQWCLSLGGGLWRMTFYFASARAEKWKFCLTYASQYGLLLKPLYVFMLRAMLHSVHLKHVLCHV